MENVLKTFSNYLNNYGFITNNDQEYNQNDKNDFNSVFSYENFKKIDTKDIFNFDNYVVDSLKSFITKYANNNKNVFEISRMIYDKFIEMDNEKILKVVRRLFLIFKSKKKRIQIKYFLNWRLITKKISNFVAVYKNKMNSTKSMNSINSMNSMNQINKIKPEIATLVTLNKTNNNKGNCNLYNNNYNGKSTCIKHNQINSQLLSLSPSNSQKNINNNVVSIAKHSRIK